MATRVKICGVKNPADLQVVLDAGAEAVGFNFIPQSRRFVDDFDLTEQMMKSVKRAGRRGIGVFAKQALDTVLETAVVVGLDGIQLHGDEPPEFVELVKQDFKGEVWKVFRVASAEDLKPIGEHCWSCDVVLLDSRAPSGALGGTGEPFDWSILSGFSMKRPFVLAGGLTVENVSEAVGRVKPDWVDVASGVEDEVGGKDPERVRRFIRNAQSKEQKR